MVDIYGFKINANLKSNMIDSLMNLVSEEKKGEIQKFKIYQDAIRCLIGDLLSRYAICKRTGYKNSQLQFDVNTYNKPLLIKPENVCFNISHSRNWVLCGISDTLVGIDVEFIRPIDFKVAKRFFTNSEYNTLLNQDIDNQLRHFYSIWTLKESYIKADGRGLALSLKSFSIDMKSDEILLVTNNELRTCFFKKYELDKRYACSVCSLDKNFNEKINLLTISDLFETLNKS